MLKNILKLNGAQQLTKNEQKTINGGVPTSCITAFDNGCLGMSNTNCANIGGNYNMLCKCCW